MTPLPQIQAPDAGCTDCHGGSAFTDSPMGLAHDVGTISTASGSRLNGNLLGIDTPTLRDLWSSAPYLHDGSAAILEELMAINSGHGFDSLTSQQRADLAAYLLQIDDAEISASNSASNWNGTLAANGGTSSFGFTVNKPTGSAMALADSFTLNSIVCESTVTPAPQ